MPFLDNKISAFYWIERDEIHEKFTLEIEAVYIISFFSSYF